MKPPKPQIKSKLLLIVLIISVALNLALISYVALEQKYKNTEYQAYKMKYSKCDTNSFTSDAEAYKAWINQKPLPSC